MTLDLHLDGLEFERVLSRVNGGAGICCTIDSIIEWLELSAAEEICLLLFGKVRHPEEGE